MGFWSGIWEGVKKVGGAVASVARKAFELMDGPSVKNAYDELGGLLEKYSMARNSPSGTSDAPDFFSGLSVGHVGKKLDDHDRKLAEQETALVQARKYMAVQTEFSRLRSSAELIDRGMANIKIHASSLLTHYQNMRNINGLIDDVNALRGGMKVIMKTFNHNMNLIGSKSGVEHLEKIEGVDINMKEGAVSMLAAFDAFDRTRQLLSDEIMDLSKLAKTHSHDIGSLKINASSLDGNIGVQVIDFIDMKIYPIISRAENGSYLLQNELKKLPSAARDEDGKIIFEDGKMKVNDGAM